MFASIRRHQKWLWILISGVTIISFVVFFSPESQRGQSGSGAQNSDTVGSINGRPITRDQYFDAYREAQLRYLFSYNRWPENDEMTRQLGIMERETKNRLLLTEKLKELDVNVGEAAIAEWIAEVFKDREQGVFRTDTYEQFVQQTLIARGLSRKDFERFVRHEVGIQHLITVAGLSGKLVTPQEAETVFRREHEQVDTEVVFLSASNYVAGVTIDPAALATFYTNRAAVYRSPERVQVTYVKFDATNYLAEAEQRMALMTNLNQLVEANYLQRGTNAFTDANKQPMTPEAAKVKIREEVRQGYALTEARKKAIEFANELVELPAQTNNLANLAAAKGLLSKVSEPFSESEEPPQLTVPPVFVQAAFRLSPQEPTYDQPIVGEDGVYLIGWNKRIPSTVPQLESIREKVVEDFRKNRIKELVTNAGTQSYNSITNALAQGKTFEAAVAEANLKSVDLPPFSQKTLALPELQNRNSLSALKTAAFALSLGKVSSFTPTSDGGFIVHLQAKVPVADSQLKAELPEFLAELRKSRQSEAFGEWLRKEMDLAHISLPGDKQSAN